MPTNNTMRDYLYWRGDLTFDIDPFNEVDNLILAQLAYVDYDGIVSEDREDQISIDEVCSLYWDRHTQEEIKKRESFVKLSPFLLKPVAESKRFGNMKLSGYVNHISKSTESQMSAVQFELEDGTIYVAFRGTDETLIGWKEDFNLSFMRQTEGQRRAAEYMKNHFKDTDLKLRVGGHSKGGNFAIYASAFSGPEVERQIIQVYSNDGPGFHEEIMRHPDYLKIRDRMISIIPGYSVIGRLFESDLTPRVIKSAASGIMQHDAMTWQVMRNRFVKTESTEDSLFYEKVLSGWLDNVDEESRRVFVDHIFSVLDTAGAGTMKDVMAPNVRDLYDMIQLARSMPKEHQREVAQVFKELLKSGEKTFCEQLESQEGIIPEIFKKWTVKREERRKLTEELEREEKATEKPEDENPSEDVSETAPAKEPAAEQPADNSPADNPRQTTENSSNDKLE